MSSRPSLPWLTLPWLTLLLTLVVMLGVFVRLRRPHPATRPAPVLKGEPKTMIWAWETPEDLRTLDPTQTGIAFLARELLLGRETTIRLRHQPLLVPEHTWLTAVVRIETDGKFRPGFTSVPELAQDIAEATQLPNVRALQVDFDASASERVFYAKLLQELRNILPPGYPLSITALTSWCGSSSWLHSLPVDEAVPMFFRMGGPAATRAGAPRSFGVIAERLCAGSAGIATDEAWPELQASQRVYVFRTGPWTKEDIAILNTKGYTGLQAAPH